MKTDSKKAFTLIELIIVVMILLILASVSIPVFSGLKGKAAAAVCAENRGITLRMYSIYRITNPDVDFETFLASEFAEEDLCPNGGDYSYIGNNVTCSHHNGEGEVGDDEENEEDPDPVDPAIITFPGGHQTLATGTWDEVIEEASLYIWSGIQLQTGAIYYDDTGYYVIRRPYRVYQDTVLSEGPDVAKLKTDSIITPDDTIHDSWTRWKDDFLLTPGMVRIHTDGKLYSYVGNEIMTEGGETEAGINATWAMLDTL